MSRVVVAGHLCVDLSPGARTLSLEPGRLSEVGPLDVSLGGSVANTGRALVALGHEVTLAARVGTDDLGRIATEHLVRTGLRGAPTVTPEAATSYSIVLEPEGADRSFWHHVGANALFDGTEASVDADVVHLGYPSLLPALCEDDGAALRALLTRVRTNGAVTSVDLAVVDASSTVDWRSVLETAMPLIDVITPSADDLRSALGDPRASAPELVELLLGWGAGVAVVSDGARGLSLGAAASGRLRSSGGALACLADEWAHARVNQPARALRRHVTTNGAGDAASAGVLSGILRGDSPSITATCAVQAAAALIEGDAARPGSPYRPEGTL
jgi:sugar/nucleoside kinase (ribokinase family)